MPEVSIIIPVYNAARYLPECLDSVLAQSLQDIEIICINDGSTDDSLVILRQYQHKNARIKVLNQKNAGVSAARNAGLAVAKGRYIGFVDSDDTVEMKYFETLYNSARTQEVDILFSQGFGESTTDTMGKIYSRREIREVILPRYFREDSYNSVCNKLYLAILISAHQIRFPVAHTHGEDAEFNIRILMYAASLFTLDYSGYYYRETLGSATRNVAQFDYLQQAVDTFLKDWSSVVGATLHRDALQQLKKERFINTIISLIYISSNPENGLSLSLRIARLRKIVRHGLVKQIFNEDYKPMTTAFTKYQKEIYRGIQSQSVITLYLLSLYSYYRNL